MSKLDSGKEWRIDVHAETVERIRCRVEAQGNVVYFNFTADEISRLARKLQGVANSVKYPPQGPKAMKVVVP